MGWWLCGQVTEVVEVWPTDRGCNLRLPGVLPCQSLSCQGLTCSAGPCFLPPSFYTIMSMRPQGWVRPLLESRLQSNPPPTHLPHSHSECSSALDGAPDLLEKGQSIGWGSWSMLSTPVQAYHPILKSAWVQSPCPQLLTQHSLLG